MSQNSVFIEFEPHEKALILQHAGFVCSKTIAKQLRDGRYRHIEFTIGDLDDISGALSHVINHDDSMGLAEAELLNFICEQMERHL